jgi:hypothetical protein
LAHSNMNVDNAAWQKQKKHDWGYAERMPFFDKPTLGAPCRSRSPVPWEMKNLGPIPSFRTCRTPRNPQTFRFHKKSSA